MPHFNYTGKTIIGLSKYRKDVQTEINRVKHLSPAQQKGQKWTIVRNRPQGILYKNDKLQQVKGIGSSMEKQINDYGIMTVMEFSIISKDDIKEVSKALKMTQKKVCE
jgi:predicted flap endonuclease-1-like 5' DNA nuclease